MVAKPAAVSRAPRRVGKTKAQSLFKRLEAEQASAREEEASEIDKQVLGNVKIQGVTKKQCVINAILVWAIATSGSTKVAEKSKTKLGSLMSKRYVEVGRRLRTLRVVLSRHDHFITFGTKIGADIWGKPDESGVIKPVIHCLSGTERRIPLGICIPMAEFHEWTMCEAWDEESCHLKKADIEAPIYLARTAFKGIASVIFGRVDDADEQKEDKPEEDEEEDEDEDDEKSDEDGDGDGEDDGAQDASGSEVAKGSDTSKGVEVQSQTPAKMQKTAKHFVPTPPKVEKPIVPPQTPVKSAA